MNARYAIVGTGGRHKMYRNAMLNQYNNRARLVGLCDSNPGRLALSANAITARLGSTVATYEARDFDRMLTEQDPGTIIVTTMDSTHDDYICRALASGCDVITEKPLTTSLEKLQRIVAAERASTGTVTVTFNYRYSPVRSQVKQLLMDGVIGNIHSVDFTWLLDTRHGADYFRRWHRNKANSGGLLVHKATHHFDLVNWWLASVPTEVAASGERRYYQPGQAAALGLKSPATRCHGCSEASRCPFHIDLDAVAQQRSLYRDQEHHDGYYRDRCVFGPDIDIEDNMRVHVTYRNGARLNYSLFAYSPWEGYRIAFNGDAGRLEHELVESSYMSGDGGVQGGNQGASITWYPHFAEAQQIPVDEAAGGHGGGDERLLEQLFMPTDSPDPLHRQADYRSGAWSCLVGIAANQSITEARAVRIDELIDDLPLPDHAS